MADTESTRCETLLAFFNKSIKDDSGLGVLNEYLAWYLLEYASKFLAIRAIFAGYAPYFRSMQIMAVVTHTTYLAGRNHMV